MSLPKASTRTVAVLYRRIRGCWSDPAVRTPVLLGAVAVVSAAAGVVSLILMPRPLDLVPGAPDDTSGLRLYYEAAFPTPGDEPLERPASVAVCGTRVYVADSIAGVVRVFDERGVPERVIGSGTLVAPASVACDASRRTVYVTDRKTAALYRYDETRGVLERIQVREMPARAASPSVGAREATAHPTAFAPLGVQVGASGEVYVTDVGSHHRVLVMDPNGVVRSEIGGPGSAIESTGVAVALDFPNDVAVVADEVWVSDSNNMRVVVFDRSGVYRRVMSLSGLIRGLTAVSASVGVKAVAAGVDALGQAIVLWDASGGEVGRVGQPGAAAGRLLYPNDVAFSADGAHLYVADTGNRRIQVWRVEAAGSSKLFPSSGNTDVSNRAPYVGAALFAFFIAVVAAVSSVSLWRRSVCMQRDSVAADTAKA